MLSVCGAIHLSEFSFKPKETCPYVHPVDLFRFSGLLQMDKGDKFVVWLLYLNP